MQFHANKVIPICKMSFSIQDFFKGEWSGCGILIRQKTEIDFITAGIEEVGALRHFHRPELLEAHVPESQREICTQHVARSLLQEKKGLPNGIFNSFHSP